MNDDEEATFAITDWEGSTKGYGKGTHCFMNDVSYVYIFYSALEHGWVFILLSDWIKFIRKIVNNVPPLCTPKCTIVYVHRGHQFESHAGIRESARKTLTDATGNADNKHLVKAHIEFYLKDI